MNSRTIPLLFAVFSLGGGMLIPGLTIAQPAYAQIPDAGSIVDDVLGSVFNGNDDDDNGATQNIEQPIDQEIEQEVDQSERNTQVNVNEQDQVGVIDQDIAQGIVDGDDSARSSSESGDVKDGVKKKKSSGSGGSSSSSSGDAFNVNAQAAENNAELVQDQQQTVTQSNTARFGDDTADQRAANVAIPIAIPINLQDEIDDVNGDNGENGAETFTVCVGPGQGTTLELTAAEIGQLILDDERVRLGACPSD